MIPLVLDCQQQRTVYNLGHVNELLPDLISNDTDNGTTINYSFIAIKRPSKSDFIVNKSDGQVVLK